MGGGCYRRFYPALPLVSRIYSQLGLKLHRKGLSYSCDRYVAPPASDRVWTDTFAMPSSPESLLSEVNKPMYTSLGIPLVYKELECLRYQPVNFQDPGMSERPESESL